MFQVRNGIIIFFLAFVEGAYAKDLIKAGTFSLATEAGWGASFELKQDGKATITPKSDGENEDGSTNPKPKVQRVKATWKELNDGIEITYDGHRDRLRFETECRDWIEYPCLRYDKSILGRENSSLLKFDYPFINWDWKNSKTSGAAKKSEPKSCMENCKKMFQEHALKKEMSLEQCIQAMCE